MMCLRPRRTRRGRIEQRCPRTRSRNKERPQNCPQDRFYGKIQRTVGDE
jgi:hypothetical protein